MMRELKPVDRFIEAVADKGIWSDYEALQAFRRKHGDDAEKHGNEAVFSVQLYPDLIFANQLAGRGKGDAAATDLASADKKGGLVQYGVSFGAGGTNVNVGDATGMVQKVEEAEKTEEQKQKEKMEKEEKEKLQATRIKLMQGFYAERCGMWVKWLREHGYLQYVSGWEELRRSFAGEEARPETNNESAANNKTNEASATQSPPSPEVKTDATTPETTKKKRHRVQELPIQPHEEGEPPKGHREPYLTKEQEDKLEKLVRRYEDANDVTMCIVLVRWIIFKSEDGLEDTGSNVV
jgi:hypothetical protein